MTRKQFNSKCRWLKNQVLSMDGITEEQKKKIRKSFHKELRPVFSLCSSYAEAWENISKIVLGIYKED